MVADDLDQAREDLTRDWAARRTPTWAIDTGLPSPQQASSNLGSTSARDRVGIVAVRHAHDRLLADATQPGRPPTPPERAEDVRTALTEAQQRLADLANLTGFYAAGPIGDAARRAEQEASRLAEIEQAATAVDRRERRQARRDLSAATTEAAAAEDRLAGLIAAERGRLEQEIGYQQTIAGDLDRQTAAAQQRWQQAASQHATVARGQQRLGRVLQGARRGLERPEAPDRATLRRRTPGNWRPAPQHVIEPEPAATQEAPGL